MFTTAFFTKLIVVRHPFDRLVSAYYNLINFKEGAGDGPYIYPDIRKKFPTLRKEVKDLTFPQFLQYVTDPSVGKYNDRHFAPYSSTCLVCSVHYDYIIRLETMQDVENSDAMPILKMLGYDNSILRQNAKTQMNAKNTSG